MKYLEIAGRVFVSFLIVMGAMSAADYAAGRTKNNDKTNDKSDD